MKNLKIYLVLVVVSFFASCDRNEVEVKEVDGELASVDAIVDFNSEFDFNSAIDIANTNSSFSSRTTVNEPSALPTCASISVNNSTAGVFPKIFTVDFGTGCTQNGITRSGILTITLSGYVMTNGSTLKIERNNYYVNARKVEGTVLYENQTTNAAIPQWTRTLTNGKITLPNGAVFTHSGTRTVKQIEGVSTVLLADNVYEVISGTHTVTRPSGSSLTATVLEPLTKKFNCNYISKGKITLVGAVLNGTLDYGNNDCDNIATYTHSNGQTYTINL